MKTYDDLYQEEEFYWGTRPNELCQAVIDHLDMPGGSRMSVVDLGCGEGKDMIHFAKHGFQATGVDISLQGLAKAQRWATREKVAIRTIRANLADFRLDEFHDVVYSSGSLTYIPPGLREEVFQNYKTYTRIGGLNAFNAFVEKPFIDTAPDWGEDEYFYRTGDLLRLYWDWEIQSFSEVIFDCDSSGIPHQHAMDIMIARKP